MSLPPFSRLAELTATACTGLTAGAMGYISIIEAPARSNLAPLEQLHHWRTSFTPAIAFFRPTGMALVPTLVACGYATSNPLYYAAALPFGLLGPFTGAAISNTNTRLLEFPLPLDKTSEREVVMLVDKWRRRHNVRVVMAATGFATALYAVSISLSKNM